tara:strand:- start:67 stop:402 length:336 start_codon:yes stop_codon:yes gene_type:complete
MTDIKWAQLEKRTPSTITGVKIVRKGDDYEYGVTLDTLKDWGLCDESWVQVALSEGFTQGKGSTQIRSATFKTHQGEPFTISEDEWLVTTSQGVQKFDASMFRSTYTIKET